MLEKLRKLTLYGSALSNHKKRKKRNLDLLRRKKQEHSICNTKEKSMFDCRALKCSLLLFSFVAGCGERGFECLAPANPGGGWDLTCRVLVQVFAEEKILEESISVRNLPGAGGGVAFAHVVAEREGDTKLIAAASTATTLRLAQGQFGSLRTRDVLWLGAVAADYAVIAVSTDAPWHTLSELLEAWRKTPETIVAAGGSAVGGQDHMKLLVLGDQADIDAKKIRYVPFDGGGEAVIALLGGFVSVVSGDVSELMSHLRGGTVRVLAVLSSKRLQPPLAYIPTAKESGYDVEWITWRGFYLPQEIGPNAYSDWIARLELFVRSPSWQNLCSRLGLSPFFVSGSQFESFIGKEVQDFSQLTKRLELSP